jgi:hypothetical protein
MVWATSIVYFYTIHSHLHGKLWHISWLRPVTRPEMITCEESGLPDFSWYKIPKQGKCTKWPQNRYIKWPLNISNGRKIGRPNGHRIYQDFPLQDPPKFTKIGIFCLKTNHMATPAKITIFIHVFTFWHITLSVNIYYKIYVRF